ncbi:MAG: MATE family efflux transporter [Lachnospiraceae bacterium]
MQSQIDFISSNTRNSFFKMAIPMMAAMFLNMAYNIVDSLWIGNLMGETAMAALTSSMPVLLILSAIGMGAANGLAIMLSQVIGAKDKEKADHLVITSFLAALIFSILLTLILELGLDVILRWLQTPKEIFDMSHDYLAVYLLGYIAVFLYFYFTAVLRSYGNTMLQAVGILLCTILNAVLDPILIRSVGFHGAAVATVISQVIAVFILFVYLLKKKMFTVRVKLFRANLIPPLVKSALPSIVQQSIPAISTSFLTAIVSGYGITAIASYGIAGKLEIILLYPAMTFNMVLTAIIGQCIGGKRTDRARDYLKCAFVYGGGFVLILSILLVVFAKSLSGLFVNTEMVASIVAMYFIIIGLGYVFNTLTNCFLGAINGRGKPVIGMLLMIFYYLLVRMPLAWLLSKTAMGINGVWCAVLVSHIVAFISAVVAYKICIAKNVERGIASSI